MQKRVLSKYDGKKYGWFFQMKELLLMVILAVLVFRFVIGVSRVVGSSMYPELEEGDIVLYTRLGSDYAYGDIVFVKMPSGEQFVKRVVALGGDTVDIRDGRLYVNDKEEAAGYVNGETAAAEGITYPYTVEEGRIFVLGDNRAVSADSRSFGAVSKRQVKGKLVWY